jgi:hypothetical protein
MPKELTHWILADRVLAQLPDDSSLRDIIVTHRNAYLAGAVLPDTLLYLHKGPFAAEAQACAHHFHDNTCNSFEPLIHAEAVQGGHLSDAQLACILGVITHMKADISFHPFVYAHAGAADIGQHYRLETDIDVYLLQNGSIPPVWLLKDLMPLSPEDVLSNVVSILFAGQRELPCQAIENAIDSHCRIQALYDSLFWKLAAALLSSVIGVPYTQRRNLFYPLYVGRNLSSTLAGCGVWQHPVTGAELHTSLDDLANEMVRNTLGIFEQIESHGSLARALSDKRGENLLTGLYGIGEAEMKIRSSANNA